MSTKPRKSHAARSITIWNIIFSLLGVLGIAPALFATKLFEPPAMVTPITLVFAVAVMTFPGVCLVSVAVSRTIMTGGSRRAALWISAAPVINLAVLASCLVLIRFLLDGASGATLQHLSQVLWPGR